MYAVERYRFVWWRMKEGVELLVAKCALDDRVGLEWEMGKGGRAGVLELMVEYMSGKGNDRIGRDAEV